ncbi:MAG: enoyl-CoA hydratase [Alphaproteobacteria bacterium]|jgi:2-(1,2-epoxy-1,2-dihydrophenyl)acetyl-CoA isomerase|nr:enoyl-CoA hydratase [Rhodospirillaceae bacterium]MDP6023181.1 enoyl-CoA hydratase [Alphaproteobacteria bacterium]MDP6253173.1 enoyl-CoA hydratase [Alphaproteobacteria bacterium]MDP7055886.1 enoyl-CoA hydratase [Alphaproteobacteria bacterium]MDP7229001.1 enoyl-CoA hydratase [Alphaproteobacteria bacterium]|tara:strand:- start:3677 stop:4471 length:795 start_codon:yes stop_codon:yes gene_type:complete
MSNTVLYETDGAIATVTLNRPGRLNAMNKELIVAMVETMERASSDLAIRVLILTGAGRGFCAGGDLAGFADGEFKEEQAIETKIADLRQSMRTSQRLRESSFVSIAAINGACAGAGLSWALACDLRYAAQSAKFSTAFLNAGLSGDFGGTFSLTQIVGTAKARELYLLSDRFSAADAERLGIVSEAVPDEDLLAHVRGKALQMADAAPVALRCIKQNLNDATKLSMSEAMDNEADRHSRCGTTEDNTEAAKAFLEKRKPSFKGR